MTEKPYPDQVISIHIAVPVQRVWDEITKTGSIQKALYNTVLDCELEPGSTLRYYSPDRSRVFIVGEVIEVELLKKFSYTYTFTTWKSGPATLVTWQFEEEDDGCRVTVTHSGWTDEHKTGQKTKSFTRRKSRVCIFIWVSARPGLIAKRFLPIIRLCFVWTKVRWWLEFVYFRISLSTI